MKENIIQYFVPINSASSTTDGNGVIVGDLLITAGHLEKQEQALTFKYQGEWHKLQAEDRILLQNETIREDGLHNDVAVYQLYGINSPLVLAEELPATGQKLESISWKHAVKCTPTGGKGVFASNTVETLELHRSEATVQEIAGNFIICDMSEKLEEGRSGSALVSGKLIYGILHGGKDGSPCHYQSSASILTAIKCIENN